MVLSNAEISRKYKVSEVSVMNWVRLASENKNNLQLETVKGKLKVKDNNHNHAELERLGSVSQKFKGSSVKEVELSDDFYKIYTEEEILEIIRDLEIRKIINLKYSYKGEGAYIWDKLAKGRQKEMKSDLTKLTELSIKTLDYYLDDRLVNLIDIGLGNGFPSVEFIENFKSNNTLQKYIPVDISPDMIKIALANLKDKLEDVDTPYYVSDFESCKFDHIFSANNNLNVESRNVILFIGSTICNQDEQLFTLKNINKGMNESDLMVLTVSFDNIFNRSNFKYIQYSTEEETRLAWHFRLLGFDVDQFQTNYFWDDKNQKKVKTYILDKDYKINFKLFGQTKEVYLHKGDQIIRWQHYLFSREKLMNLVEMAGFKILSYQIDDKSQNALVVCSLS